VPSAEYGALFHTQGVITNRLQKPGQFAASGRDKESQESTETIMSVLVAYSTGEGQTRKIARRVAGRIADHGHGVELITLVDADGIDLERFDRVILAASIHMGHYQRALTDFAAKHAAQLQAKPVLLLSVSLAAAGHDAEDWKAAEHILQDLKAAAGWTPGQVEHVAGAYLPSKYDMFRRFIMRRIIAAKDPDADLDADKEYTDWKALDILIDGFSEPSGRPAAPGQSA
jgi:menaquinone-dependent protoporphyrinogen oxidase